MASASIDSPSATVTAAIGCGRVLALTRAGIWVLLVLAALNGLFLYLLPGNRGHRLRVVDQAAGELGARAEWLTQALKPCDFQA